MEGDPLACFLQFWLCLNTCIGGGITSAWLPVPAGVVTVFLLMFLCEELCYELMLSGGAGEVSCPSQERFWRGGESSIQKRQSEPKVFPEKIFVRAGWLCLCSPMPPTPLLFICGKCPSLSQQMDLASLVGRIRVVHPVGSSAFFDWVPWSMNFLRKARDGSKTSFLLVPLFQFPPFGRTEFDFLSHCYYGLQRTALKLALRRWKGRGVAVGGLV